MAVQESRIPNSVDVLLSIILFSLVLETGHCSDRIIGLERRSEIHLEDPSRGWKMLMSYEDVCAGVLLSPTEAMTTCDCVLEKNDSDDIFWSPKKENDDPLRIIDVSELRVRTKDILEPYTDYVDITEIRVHPQCDGEGSYDFAMLRLAKPINVTKKLFFNYPFGGEWNGKWSNEVVLGLEGSDSECHVASHLSNALMWSHPLWMKRLHDGLTVIPVEIMDMTYCNRFITIGRKQKNFDWQTKLCVEASTKPLPICKTDLGSPLICNDTLVGITTATKLFCNYHDAFTIVSTLDGAWSFVYDFMGIGPKHWCLCLAKKFYSWFIFVFKSIVMYGL